MIRDLILVCGCKVELTMIEPVRRELLEDIPIKGRLTYPCKLHETLPALRSGKMRIPVTGLN